MARRRPARDRDPLSDAARPAARRGRPRHRALFRDGAGAPPGAPPGTSRMTPRLPHGAAVVVLGPSGAALGRRIRDLLPGATLFGPRAHPLPNPPPLAGEGRVG